MRSRRRKNFAALVRNIERPTTPNTSVGVASSINGGGDTVNGQDTRDSENRGLSFALPYGISSSGIDGIRIQMILNDNQNNVAVGVIDDKKPKVKPGCIIIYDKAGSSISLNGDGTVTINANSIDIKGYATINGSRIAKVGDTVVTPEGAGTIV